MRSLIFTCPILLFADINTCLLDQAQTISEHYYQAVSKFPPPSLTPQTQSALMTSATWFYLSSTTNSMSEEAAVAYIQNPSLWPMLNELGFDGVFLDNIKENFSISIKPSWQNAWNQICQNAKQNRISLVGSVIGNSIPQGPDFDKALQNDPKYRDLFYLIEIPQSEWGNLPRVPDSSSDTNVPWLDLQQLQKNGFVPLDFSPYVKESNWNTTKPILGIDGIERRWIYLKENSNRPVLNWLSPGFSADQLLFADIINAKFNLDQKFVQLDGSISLNSLNTNSLSVRKIQNYSIATTDGTIDSCKRASSDLIQDTITQSALLHALITKDAEMLRLIYRIIIDEKINSNRFVHRLQPFDQYACSWVEFIKSAKIQFRYYDEKLTGEILRTRLLNEDVQRIKEKAPLIPAYWTELCARALNISEFTKNEEQITKAHLLLSFFYAMQPGAFCISFDDLVGTLPKVENNPQTQLYSKITDQLINPKSFVNQLKQILNMRNQYQLPTASLLKILPSDNKGTIILLHKLNTPDSFQITALNFGEKSVEESISLNEICNTSAINIMSQKLEKKIFSSSEFSFTLPPMTGKAIYFQPKYFD